MAELYTIQVFLDIPNGAQNAMINLTYTDADRAHAARNQMVDAQYGKVVVDKFQEREFLTTVTDDFGRVVVLQSTRIAAIQFNDVARELEGQSQLTEMQTRANMRFQQRMKNDPMLQFQHQNQGVASLIPRN